MSRNKTRKNPARLRVVDVPTAQRHTTLFAVDNQGTAINVEELYFVEVANDDVDNFLELSDSERTAESRKWGYPADYRPL